MKAIRIIVSLLKVPRLFTSLLLFPLLGALLVVAAQLFVSGSALRQISEEKNTSDPVAGIPQVKDFQFLRLILFGSGTPLPQAQLCIWNKTSANEKEAERPPSAECNPDLLDVALLVEDGIKVDVAEYLRLVNGNALRLHLCKSCKPDLQIIVSSSGPSVKAHSTYGLMMLGLLMMDKQIHSQVKQLLQDRNTLKKKFGTILFFLPELRAPIDVSSMEVSLVFILNITAVVVIALWLGLRAHRRVLEYFTKSGALLPMVAATGKNAFYGALWGITGLRVLTFLLASVPLMFLVLESAAEQHSVIGIFSGSWLSFILWLIALFSSMTLATLIASVSDLKGRHEIFSIIYKIIPLILSGLGVLIWTASFLVTSESAGVFRSILAAFPILGMGPMILAPVIQPQFYVLIIHATSSLVLVWLLMRKNARWFAAHLEEI